MLSNLTRLARCGANSKGRITRSFSRARVPEPKNEPVLSYLKGSPERTAIQNQIKEMRGKTVEIPVVIGGKEIRTGKTVPVIIPHEKNTTIAICHQATDKETKLAIETAVRAQHEWARMPFAHRLAIFLKAADLLAGPYRQVLNAATVLGQSKNFFQAEIDSACELIDFFRFNAKYVEEIISDQPISSPGVWNRLEYRSLEGFVYAISPFNFTAIAGNLVSSPAMFGNVAIWKPSNYAVLSGHYLMKLFAEAGVPDGVINFLPGPPEPITEQLVAHPKFAGLHYTGSTAVFQQLWLKIAQNLPRYEGYPRIVGETGGKDFVFAHSSADIPALATALVRGAFEYAGQKCSAASRAYVPTSIWPKLKQDMLQQLSQVKVGNPENPEVLVNAVIHEQAADKSANYIKYAKDHKDECEIVFGGTVDKSVGWFVTPTVIVTKNPASRLLQEEMFAPILTIYLYPDNEYEKTLQICDKGSPYGLTGSIFAQDRNAIIVAEQALVHSAGNFYINDKPTGAVVAQQPFGGSRASGTNDKAGSRLNLLRWTSVRTIKETFVPPRNFTYPYMSN